MTYNFQNKTNKGFTLIETMVAVMILMTAIVGPLAIASKGLSTSLIAKDQLTAFYLAQDAIEYTRFIRDTNRLESKPWLAGLDGTVNGHTNSGSAGGVCTSTDGSQSCLIDSIMDTTASCGAPLCSTALDYDSTNNWFSYTSGSGSIFTRTVAIINTPAHPDEADVTVTVSWHDVGGVARSVAEREELYNWQP
jgi:Tfp pilus assembly protein PilV